MKQALSVGVVHCRSSLGRAVLVETSVGVVERSSLGRALGEAREGSSARRMLPEKTIWPCAFWCQKVWHGFAIFFGTIAGLAFLGLGAYDSESISAQQHRVGGGAYFFVIVELISEVQAWFDVICGGDSDTIGGARGAITMSYITIWRVVFTVFKIMPGVLTPLLFKEGNMCVTGCVMFEKDMDGEEDPTLGCVEYAEDIEAYTQKCGMLLNVLLWTFCSVPFDSLAAEFVLARGLEDPESYFKIPIVGWEAKAVMIAIRPIIATMQAMFCVYAFAESGNVSDLFTSTTAFQLVLAAEIYLILKNCFCTWLVYGAGGEGPSISKAVQVN